MKQLLAVLILVCAWPALAQTPVQALSFDGCTDAKGNAVAAIADEKLAAVVQLGLDEGKPVIRYNPQALPRLLLETRLFVYAHECGRQYLGFAAQGERTLAQARQADCWAYNSLKRAALSSAPVIGAVEDDMNAVPEDWSQLPGPAREVKLASCAATPIATGSVKLPSGPARDKWNTCQQACGSKLYSCGRGASCETAFAQCSEACGK